MKNTITIICAIFFFCCFAFYISEKTSSSKHVHVVTSAVVEPEVPHVVHVPETIILASAPVEAGRVRLSKPAAVSTRASDELIHPLVPNFRLKEKKTVKKPDFVLEEK
jgi:hypothetical protein